MSIYDLYNAQHLENDLNNIIQRLNDVYSINIEKTAFSCIERLFLLLVLFRSGFPRCSLIEPLVAPSKYYLSRIATIFLKLRMQYFDASVDWKNSTSLLHLFCATKCF